MNVEIITIGDELLIGQVVDTNSAWMATVLNEAGFRISHITTVADDETQILSALSHARSRVGIILMTGGLGPTKDDLTRDTLCKYFNCGLVLDPKILADLTAFFASRGKTLTATNRAQAEVPEKCIPIYNTLGTAPGMYFEEEGAIYASMPGVPFEMMNMMTGFVLPKLQSAFNLPRVFHHTITTVGIGESFLSDILSEFESSLPSYIKLAYLPSVGLVRLRLSCYGSDPEIEKQILDLSEKASGLIGKYVFGYGNSDPEQIIGNMLLEKGHTIAVAESCTGGYISHLITSVPGCSRYYIGSSVSYANEVKTRFLDVDPAVIATKGAVSEEVAIAMATGVRNRLGSTWALATTGIAGPDGGTAEKPVGTVWIGLAGPNKVFAKKFKFVNNRSRNIHLTAIYAFDLLKNELVDY